MACCRKFIGKGVGNSLLKMWGLLKNHWLSLICNLGNNRSKNNSSSVGQSHVDQRISSPPSNNPARPSSYTITQPMWQTTKIYIKVQGAGMVRTSHLGISSGLHGLARIWKQSVQTEVS